MKLFKFLAFGALMCSGQLGFSQTSSSINADIPYVDHFCYEESMVSTIRVESTLETSTLSLKDKLRFTEKSYKKRHKHYLDDDGDAVHEIQTDSHSNIYPAWYHKSYKSKRSKDGIYTFYTNDGKYLKGGWLGATRKNSPSGTFGIDQRSGELYHHAKYSGKAYDHFVHYNSLAQTHGFLVSYVWKMPTQDVINEFIQEGYTVSFDKSVLTIMGDASIMVWDENTRTYIFQILEGSTVSSTTTIVYDLNTALDYYVMTETVLEQAGMFSNGDCYSVVTTTTYADIHLCDGMEFTDSNIVQSRSIKSDSEFIDRGYLIRPNPVDDLLYLEVPVSESSCQLTIFDSAGSLMLQRKVGAFVASFQADVADLPSGVYFITISTSADSFSSKFVKL